MQMGEWIRCQSTLRLSPVPGPDDQFKFLLQITDYSNMLCNEFGEIEMDPGPATQMESDFTQARILLN
jgi:hypothetical protein